MRYLTPFEERLIELVHILAAGTPEEYGLTFNEVKQILIKKMPRQSDTILESLEKNDQVIQDIRKYIES